MDLHLGLRTRAFWDDLQSSLWFRPFLLTALSIVVALSNTVLERYLALPPLLNTSADNARAILTAIASSMLTVTSVTFSIVMVALVLASQQFSPRILRNFMADRATQNVLGIFIGSFMHSMIVMGSISDRDEATFVPALSTLIALGFALLSVGVFIYFINHIARGIQVSNIIAKIAADTESLLHETFQDEFVTEQPQLNGQQLPDLGAGAAVLASDSGYIQGIDLRELVNVAQEHDCVFYLRCDIGNFVVVGSSLLTVHPATALSPACDEQLHGNFDIGHERTLFADILFGIRQLVDIALKAISPAINDPTTAVNCIDYLYSLLIQANRYPDLPSHYYDKSGQLRLIMLRVTFADMLNLAFDQIRQYATSDVAVILRLLDVLINITAANGYDERQFLLFSQAQSIRTAAEKDIQVAADRQAVNIRLQQLAQLLPHSPAITLLP
jgi:uncharacterized membrane protein